MTPAQLDQILAANRKPGSHGERNCPNCERGFMAYQVFGPSHIYACTAEGCGWIELREPPWPKRT